MTLCVSIIIAPLSQCGRSDDALAAHCLKLPGNYLNLSVLLDKKFRTYGHKTGALRGFKLLKDDDLGTIECCGGRGSNAVVFSVQLPCIDDA